jgi:hypothetical protein
MSLSFPLEVRYTRTFITFMQSSCYCVLCSESIIYIRLWKHRPSLESSIADHSKASGTHLAAQLYIGLINDANVSNYFDIENKAAASSKAWAVFAGSNAEVMGSDPTRGVKVCVRLFCVQVAVLVWADPPSKESYRLCTKIKKLKKRPRPKKGLSSPR